jgi:hypothetical protein
MKTSALFLSSLVLIGVAACTTTSDITSSGTTPPGAMTYIAYDDAGRPVVTGWIRLDIPDAAVASADAAVTGEWSLDAHVDPDLVGQQEGNGELEGDFHDGDLVVALYPGVVDGGCFLVGVLTVGGGPAGRMAYAGTWSDQSITGPHHQGTFQAKQ